MTVAVFLVNNTVVIDKILVSRIVRWIDIDNINLSLMRVGK